MSLWLAHLLANRAAIADSRVRALADAAIDGVIIVRAGHIVTVNAALVRLMGVGPGWFDHRAIDALLDGGGPSHLDPTERMRADPA